MTGLQALLDLRDHRAYRVRLVLPGYRVSRDHRVFRDRLGLEVPQALPAFRGLQELRALQDRLEQWVSRDRLDLPGQPGRRASRASSDLPEPTVLPALLALPAHRVFRDRLDLPGLLAHRVSRGRLGLPEQPEPPEQPELPDLPE